MIRVNNIHLSLDYDDKSIRKAVAKQLRIEEKSIKSCKIFRLVTVYATQQAVL